MEGEEELFQAPADANSEWLGGAESTAGAWWQEGSVSRGECDAHSNAFCCPPWGQGTEPAGRLCWEQV